MDKLFCVYIMTNKYRTAIYTGVTSDIKSRVWRHKTGAVEGFTKRYKLTILVYYEVCPGAEAAILREKQIKGGSRKKKEELITGVNPTWRDLYDDL